jgi:hypothetical protein
MSVQRSADADAESETDAERLARYLRQEAADGEFYCKSKFIADDVGMTASQIGNLIPDLGEREELVVERWAYTNATTWRVTVDDDPADAGTAATPADD